ncbi:MAG: helix-turn-helix transcriptional regulator [Geodermatophilaceae bacterium]|nr:helix-turn-helix transcriptional regulator [Geodermatophilaceae bacterium]
MTTRPSSSDRQAREALGVRLRELRKDAGLHARVLASATGQHYTRVSKIEHGVQAPNDDDIRAWCRACGAEDQALDLIATLRSVESAYLEFRRQSRAGMKRVLGAHTLALYERTKLFRIYEHNVIPGLFQTAEYCAAMLSFWIGFLKTPDALGDAVAGRMERQRAIYNGGRRFVCVLEEQALRTWFGTAEIQAGQLDRLLALMSLSNVSLGIVPLMIERVAVGSTGFWIFDDTLVALETATASIEVNRPQEVEPYARMFEALKAPAVYGRAARELIAKAIDELSSRQPPPTTPAGSLGAGTVGAGADLRASSR